MNRLYFIIVLTFILVFETKAQQEAQFSQYMFNNFSINPAYAGINDAICGNIFHRQQWVGFDGRPVTTLITFDGALPFIHGGAGIQILQDKIGQFNDLDVKLAYAYHYKIGEGKLSGGLQAGFLNKKIDFSKFNPIDETDPLLQGKSQESNMSVDIAFGAFYTVPNKYYAGISSSQLIESKESYKEASLKLKRHYYITGGYHYGLDNFGLSNFKIIPSTLIKTDAVSFQFDINLLAEYNNKFWAGFSYRRTDAVVILLGLKPFGPGLYENLKIGYSYDMTTSAIGKDGRSSGSHEVYIGYCFKLETKKEPTSYKNVRFL
ncbi:MAG: type IX secretion system membrane protein PorP/SprF [Bacteroidales bacterium]|nr:type IX secretion system membrane protein PorP/SprF [Bacteroidales bacterium]